MERSGPEVDQRVGGEQRRGHGRPGGARAAVLHQHLERQQGQHPPRRLEAEAAPPASAHAGPHLPRPRGRHRTKAAASFSPPHANSPLEIPPPSYRLAALGSFYFWTGLGIGLLLSSGAREGTDGGEATEPSGGL